MIFNFPHKYLLVASEDSIIMKIDLIYYRKYLKY